MKRVIFKNTTGKIFLVKETEYGIPIYQAMRTAKTIKEPSHRYLETTNIDTAHAWIGATK